MAQVPEQVPHAPENPVAEAIVPQNPVAEPPVPPPPVVENAANAENLEVFLLHSFASSLSRTLVSRFVLLSLRSPLRFPSLVFTLRPFCSFSPVHFKLSSHISVFYFCLPCARFALL